ncbi:MAG TPA: hypothetical protein VFR42_05695, partial [Candidatus Acidoferrum sp.]|nr:hypothetical protein [Candidatus Acidoferrum sp.]
PDLDGIQLLFDISGWPYTFPTLGSYPVSGSRLFCVTMIAFSTLLGLRMYFLRWPATFPLALCPSRGPVRCLFL